MQIKITKYQVSSWVIIQTHADQRPEETTTNVDEVSRSQQAWTDKIQTLKLNAQAFALNHAEV